MDCENSGLDNRSERSNTDFRIARIGYSGDQNFHAAGFILLIVFVSLYFRNSFVVGTPSGGIGVFAACHILMLTLCCHLFLIAYIPFGVYCGIVAVDYLLKIGIATYAPFFVENVDMHVVISNFGEGLKFTDYALELVPKHLIIGSIAAACIQCVFARSLYKNKRFAGRCALILVLPVFAASLISYRAVSLERAVLSRDYARCISFHGYYTTILSDLLFAGFVPDDDSGC